MPPRPLRLSPALLALLVATACGSEAPGAPPADPPPSRVDSSPNGMVVSGSAPATRAGVEILEAGGNAVDAAVATAFALAVTEPTQSSLGGRTQALVWRPDGDAFGVDGTTAVPLAYDPDTAPQAEDGYSVVGVPGSVAALARLVARGGSMPWSRLLEPAVRLADAGFEISEGEAARLAEIRGRLLESEGAARALLRPDGSAYRAGDLLRQPELAEVLRILQREGPESFYRGELARRMAEDFAARGASVTAGDLADYRAETSLIARGRFGSLDLLGTYLPASGATTIEALQILERVGLAEMDPDARAVAQGHALLMAFEDREAALQDSRSAEEDVAWVTSRARAEARALELTGLLAGLSLPTEPPGAAEPFEYAHTTHLSVVDAAGAAVAMTQSLGPTGGARVATPGLGFLYAATLGGYLGRVEPGDRPWSSQSPLVAVRDGRLQHVLGGAGSRRIISALVQTLVRLEVDGLALAEGMAAPRFHPTAGRWTFERAADVELEPAGVVLARARGVEVEVRPTDVFFARLNVITWDPTRDAWTGVADPRWRWGAALGPR